MILLLSAGLLEGDCISTEVIVEPGARLALRTQAATQVHTGRSQQRLRATVDEHGWFSYVPHAIVPHRGADHHVTTHVSLAADARALVADSLSPGRVQFGERFVYDQVRIDLDAHLGPALVARERALIRPDPALQSAQWAQFSHVAGAYLLGPGEPPAFVSSPDVLVGSSALGRGGWFVRAMAHRATAIEALLTDLAAQWWQTGAT